MKKLKLNQLKVRSFVTAIDDEQLKTVKGGVPGNPDVNTTPDGGPDGVFFGGTLIAAIDATAAAIGRHFQSVKFGGCS